MIQSLVIGIGLTSALVLGWAVVQAHWKNIFREEYLEEDVLAGRRSCSNCGCTNLCKKNKEGGSEFKKSIVRRKLLNKEYKKT